MFAITFCFLLLLYIVIFIVSINKSNFQMFAEKNILKCKLPNLLLFYYNPPFQSKSLKPPSFLS